MTLECGHVSVPVALRGASEKKDVTFDRALKVVVNEHEVAHGEEPIYEFRRVKRLEIADPEGEVTSLTIKPLRRKPNGEVEGLQYDGETVKGVWDGETFHEILPTEVALIEEMTTLDALTIQEFVPLSDIPWERAQASYFLAPAAKAGTGALRIIATLYEAMAAKNVAGVAKLMPKSRQKLSLIYPKHGGLMVTCLAYADTYEQVLQGAASISGVEANPDALELLSLLIDLKSEPVEVIDQYRDDAIDLRSDLIERARLGQALASEEEEAESGAASTPATDDALLEALKASVAQIKKAKKPAAKKTSSRKAPSGRAPAKA
jgi:DNA end-binding protein Ku